MKNAICFQTRILPNHRIEISDPELEVGQVAEVIVITSKKPESKYGSVLEFLDSLPAGPSPRAFKTWEEYEKHLQEERNSWD